MNDKPDQEGTAGTSRQPPIREELVVVGIGASAGGLAALEGFFDKMLSGINGREAYANFYY